MTIRQTTLDFPSPNNHARGRFIIGACNAMAADWIDRWPEWPGMIRALIIHGPRCSGKTHLASIWTETSGATTLTHLKDGIDHLDPTQHYVFEGLAPTSDWPDYMVFLALTRFTGAAGSLLMLADQSPASMPWKLADVASRLAVINTAQITMPDDAMLHNLLQKLADDKGLALDEDIITYIVKRMERRYESAVHTIQALDEMSITEKKKVNLSMARKILNNGQATLF